MTTKFKSAYNRPDKCVLKFDPEFPSRTKQSHKLECDINHIIKKHDKLGILTHVNKAIAMYGDFTEKNEYADAQNLITTADKNFLALPSEVRRKFDHKADEFLEFATNPDNLDEMVSMGLAIKPKKVKKPLPTEVTIISSEKNEESIKKDV